MLATFAPAYRHTEGLNSAIEVHVKEGILIVPDARRRVRYFVAHKPNAVVTRIGLDLIDCCTRSCPALMAGCIRTVEPAGEKLKDVGPPLTEN